MPVCLMVVELEGGSLTIEVPPRGTPARSYTVGTAGVTQRVGPHYDRPVCAYVIDDNPCKLC